MIIISVRVFSILFERLARCLCFLTHLLYIVWVKRVASRISFALESVLRGGKQYQIRMIK